MKQFLLPLLATASSLFSTPLIGSDRDRQVRWEDLVQQAASDDNTTALRAIRELSQLDDPRVPTALVARADHLQNDVRIAAAALRALGDLQVESALPLLQAASEVNNETLRKAALHGLMAMQAISEEQLLQLLQDPQAGARSAAAAFLIQQPLSAEGRSALSQCLSKDHDSFVRRLAAQGLAEQGSKQDGPALADALADSSLDVRRQAARGLARLKYRPAIPQLLIALESGFISDELNAALETIAGRGFGYQSDANAAQRKQVIEEAFSWYTSSFKGGMKVKN